jgi:hypothetical protein
MTASDYPRALGISLVHITLELIEGVSLVRDMKPKAKLECQG